MTTTENATSCIRPCTGTGRPITETTKSHQSDSTRVFTVWRCDTCGRVLDPSE